MDIVGLDKLVFVVRNDRIWEEHCIAIVDVDDMSWNSVETLKVVRHDVKTCWSGNRLRSGFCRFFFGRLLRKSYTETEVVEK